MARDLIESLQRGYAFGEGMRETERKNKLRELLKSGMVPYEETIPARPQYGVTQAGEPLPEIPAETQTRYQFDYPNTIATLMQGGFGEEGLALQKQYEENELRKALYGTKDLAARAAISRSLSGGSETQQEGYIRKLKEYQIKKMNNIPTSPEEDIEATTIYEVMTQPKVTAEGDIIQPRLSVGGAITGIPQVSTGMGGGPVGRSQYSQQPFGTPRVSVTPGTKPALRLSEDVKDFSEKYNKLQIPEFSNALKNVLSVAVSKGGKTMPGVGGLQNIQTANIGALFRSGEGEEINPSVQALFNMGLAIRAGLSQTQGEAIRQSIEKARSPLATDKDYLEALGLVSQGYKNLKNNLKAGYKSDITKAYEMNSGMPAFDPELDMLIDRFSELRPSPAQKRVPQIMGTRQTTQTQQKADRTKFKSDEDYLKYLRGLTK